MNQDIHFVFTLDNSYVQHLAVVISSILQNCSAEYTITLHILGDKITSTNKRRIAELKSIRDFTIQYYPINQDLFRNAMPDPSKFLDHVNYSTHYRYLVAKLLPTTLEKVIYLDADLVVIRDISKLWQIDIDGYYCGAVEEAFTHEQRS